MSVTNRLFCPRNKKAVNEQLVASCLILDVRTNRKEKTDSSEPKEEDTEDGKEECFFEIIFNQKRRILGMVFDVFYKKAFQLFLFKWQKKIFKA